MKMLLRNAQTYADYSEGQKNYLHRKKIYRLGITWGRILFLFSFLLLSSIETRPFRRLLELDHLLFWDFALLVQRFGGWTF